MQIYKIMSVTTKEISACFKTR